LQTEVVSLPISEEHPN